MVEMVVEEEELEGMVDQLVLVVQVLLIKVMMVEEVMLVLTLLVVAEEEQVQSVELFLETNNLEVLEEQE